MLMARYTRRILSAFVEEVVPPQLLDHHDLVSESAASVDALIAQYPPFKRCGLVLTLYFLEWGGPILLIGLLPFSVLPRAARTQRVRALLKHKLWFFRTPVKFLRIVVCLAVFSRPEAEAEFEAPRRDWRENRKRFRAQLVKLDESRQDPAIPQPLGSEPLCSKADYLDARPIASDALTKLSVPSELEPN